MSFLQKIEPTDMLGYVAALFEPGDSPAFVLLDPTKKKKPITRIDSLAAALESNTVASIADLQSQGYNAYICMNPVDPAANSREKQHIRAIRSVYLDVDRDGNNVFHAIMARVKSDEIPCPHFIVGTSYGKFQVVWLVSGFTIETQEALNKQLQKIFGSDPAATDASRVLRLPGTLNLKYPEKPVCTIIYQNPAPRYTLADFKLRQGVPAPIAKVEQSEVQILDTKKGRFVQAPGAPLTTKKVVLMDGEIVSRKPFRVEDLFGSYVEYPTQSEADEALMTLLCADHDGDFDRVDADFRASSLYREKYEKQKGYAERTFKFALKCYEQSKTAVAKSSVSSLQATSSEITTTLASDVSMKKIDWLWDNRVPFGKLTVFAGNPDQGKSIVTMYMTGRLTTGHPLEGSPTSLSPCEVLVLAGEDDASDTIVPRLKTAGADLDRVHLVESVTTRGIGGSQEEREVQLDTDVRQIEDYLTKFPNIRLVVIDPVSNYLGRANMNREQEVRAVLIPLKKLAARTGVAILGVMHLNKNSEASAIHRIGGAMAFSGVARAAWLFTSDSVEKDIHMMVRIKKNIGSSVDGLKYKISVRPLFIEGETTQQPCIEWLGSTDATADEILVKGIAGRPAQERMAATDWLISFLTEGEGCTQTADDVIRFGKKSGYAERTLRRAKDEIGVFAYKGDKRWYWMLRRNGVPAVQPVEGAEKIEQQEGAL